MKKLIALSLVLVMCAAALASCAGLSAYEIAVENGFEGTEEEWLASLKGETGDAGAKGETGDIGDKGADGQDGADGKQGADGQDGKPGANGQPGAKGDDAPEIKAPYVGEDGYWYINGVQSPWKVDGTKDENVSDTPTVSPEDAAMIEILNQAFALEKGAALEGAKTLKGVISAINTPYANDVITVTIIVAGVVDKPIQCYKLKGTGADALTVGDTITVTGTIKNYNGTIEFDQDGNLDAVVKHACVYRTLANKCDICGVISEHTCADANTDTACDLCGKPIINAELKATLSFENESTRTSQDSNSQVWADNGITLTNEKAGATSNVGTYVNPARFYKNSSVTVTYTGMKQIVFVCTTTGYAEDLQEAISDENASVTIDGTKTIITFTNAVDSFTTTLSAGKVFVSSLEIYG